RCTGQLGDECGNHVGDRGMSEVGLVRILAHCAERVVPVFVHPWDMPAGPRLHRWMAQWLVGMPAETHLTMLAMILGGVFDRVPEDRKSVVEGKSERMGGGAI